MKGHVFLLFGNLTLELVALGFPIAQHVLYLVHGCKVLFLYLGLVCLELGNLYLRLGKLALHGDPLGGLLVELLL
jgi:hypothetical protein